MLQALHVSLITFKLNMDKRFRNSKSALTAYHGTSQLEYKVFSVNTSSNI